MPIEPISKVGGVSESAKYTIVLRTLIENGYDIGLNGAVYDNTDPENPVLVTPEDYPIFDETHRAELKQKIIDRYYFHEIGFETEARFKFRLNAKMREIMPYYNQLYETETQLTGDDLTSFKRDSSATTVVDSDIVEDRDRVTSQKSKGAESDTPDNLLQAVDLDADVYASKGTRDELDGTEENDNVIRRDETTTVTGSDSGRDATESELIQRKRDILLNIDQLIMDELESLFMGVL